MQKLTILLIISLVFAVSGVISAVSAVDLPADFDEPCPSGMSVLQVTCVGVNLNHDKIDVNTSDIDNLQSSLVTIQDHIDEHHLEVSILNTENDGLESRIFALEDNQSCIGNVEFVKVIDVRGIETFFPELVDVAAMESLPGFCVSNTELALFQDLGISGKRFIILVEYAAVP